MSKRTRLMHVSPWAFGVHPPQSLKYPVGRTVFTSDNIHQKQLALVEEEDERHSGLGWRYSNGQTTVLGKQGKAAVTQQLIVSVHSHPSLPHTVVSYWDAKPDESELFTDLMLRWQNSLLITIINCNKCTIERCTQRVTFNVLNLYAQVHQVQQKVNYISVVVYIFISATGQRRWVKHMTWQNNYM